MNAIFTKYPDPTCVGCAVHEGFWVTYLSLREQFMDAYHAAQTKAPHAQVRQHGRGREGERDRGASIALPRGRRRVEASHYRGPWSLSVPFTLRASASVCQVWVTGHSLGGALALHAAMDLLSSEGAKVTHLVTFGQPRVGNMEVRAGLNGVSLKEVRKRFCHDGTILHRTELEEERGAISCLDTCAFP